MSKTIKPAAVTHNADTATKEYPLNRRSMLRAGFLLCCLPVQHLVHAQIGPQHVPKSAGIGSRKGIVAVRIWPSPEYSRVTIESDNELDATHQMLEHPLRMFVDIQNLQLGSELRNIETRVQADDPNIASIRIAQNSPTVVRMVVDLKQKVRAEVFTLKPIDPYRYRLVFDLYPLHPVDPMAQLIEERLQTIAQIPGAAAQPEQEEVALLPDALDLWVEQHGRALPPTTTPLQPPTTPPLQPSKPLLPPTTPPPPPPKPPRKPPPPSPPASSLQTDRIYIIAIDPGHGGEDPGAIGKRGTYEKNIVLSIGRLLRDRINRQRVNGIPLQAFMTRDGDFFVPLVQRVERSRRVQADLFLSIHADAALNRNARGASVYALNPRGATSAAARLLAEQENRADQVGGLNIRSKDQAVQGVLAEMSLTAQIRDSLLLGTAMRNAMSKAVTVRGTRVEQANFAVLRNPDTPAILIETAFISNLEDERLLISPAYQARLADAITSGVVNYLRSHPPMPRVRRI